jgi:fused signal recognition particle receptor
MLAHLISRLAKTRQNLVMKLSDVIGGRSIADAATLERIESLLLSCDVGVEITERLVERVKGSDGEENIISTLRTEMAEILLAAEQPLELHEDNLSVVLTVGVNGVGKTTTIAKLAQRFKAQGKTVMLAAADTYRAAALEQIQIWGARLGVDVISRPTGSDPSAVVHDACESALKKSIDVLIVDTAGRLHTDRNLMDELSKIRRVSSRAAPDTQTKTLLVLDATMGQNIIVQTEHFNAAAEVQGLAVTKLDGTAKGGVICSLADKFKIPIWFVAVGEGEKDLLPFNATDFVNAILDP